MFIETFYSALHYGMLREWFVTDVPLTRGRSRSWSLVSNATRVISWTPFPLRYPSSRVAIGCCRSFSLVFVFSPMREGTFPSSTTSGGWRGQNTHLFGALRATGRYERPRDWQNLFFVDV